MLREDRLFPVEEKLWLLKNMQEGHDGDNYVQRQIDAHKYDGDVDRFLESFEEDGAQDREQQEGNGHLVLQGMRGERIVNKVGRCVRGRERHGDDEVGGGKAQKDKHEYFAAPTREEVFEHRYAALPVRTGGRHPVVDGQRREQRHEYQNQGRDGRENARSEKRDAGLVTECGEVVDPGQTHHPPPRVSARVAVRVSTLRAFEIGEKPICKGHGCSHLLIAGPVIGTRALPVQ